LGSLGAVVGSCSAWMLCWAAIGSSMQASRLAMRVGSCSALAAWMLCLGSRSGVHVLFMFKFMVIVNMFALLFCFMFVYFFIFHIFVCFFLICLFFIFILFVVRPCAILI